MPNRNKEVSRAIEELARRNGPAKSRTPQEGKTRSPSRPTILITTDEGEVNRQAVEALAVYPGLYQRGGMLVRVCRDVAAPRGIRRPGAPRIEALPYPLLREMLSNAAEWRKPGKEDQTHPAHPPEWSVSAVAARGTSPAIPILESVVDYPVLLADGQLLGTSGYHAETGLLLDLDGRKPSDLPAHPNRDHAREALELLLDVVSDFPFASDVHRSAWCAALLTPLARFAHNGPAPLFLSDANVRAAGKGLLLEVVARIVTGSPMSVATYTQDGDELRKRITALAIHGE